jgi:hypothetical protein
MQGAYKVKVLAISLVSPDPNHYQLGRSSGRFSMKGDRLSKTCPLETVKSTFLLTSSSSSAPVMK